MCMVFINKLAQTSRVTRGFGSTNKKRDMAFIKRLQVQHTISTTDKITLAVHSNPKPDAPEDRFSAQTALSLLPGKVQSPAPLPSAPPILQENSVKYYLPKSARFIHYYTAQATGYYKQQKLHQVPPTTRLEH